VNQIVSQLGYRKRGLFPSLQGAKRAPSSSAEAAEFGSPEQAMDSVNTVGILAETDPTLDPEDFRSDPA